MRKKSSADYQREYRKRLRDQGLVKKEVWILPANRESLTAFEKELRKPLAINTIGAHTMNDTNAHRWETLSLFQALEKLPHFSNGSCSIEIIEGLDPTIVASMHHYGDLPIFITAGGEQILAEAVLFAMDNVEDPALFNEYVLKMHKNYSLKK